MENNIQVNKHINIFFINAAIAILVPSSTMLLLAALFPQTDWLIAGIVYLSILCLHSLILLVLAPFWFKTDRIKARNLTLSIILVWTLPYLTGYIINFFV